MKQGVRNTVIVLVLVVLGVIGLTVNKYTSTKAGIDKEALRELGVVWYETPRTFAFNPLSMAEGKTFTHEHLKDRWTLMYFGFTFCPDICPAALAHMAQLKKELKVLNPQVADRVDVVLVSVDPNRDNPEKLTGYVNFFDPEFKGATSDPANLKALTQQLNVAFEIVGDTSSADYLVEHSAQVVLINPMGDYQGFLKPPFKAADLAKAMIQVDQNF
ncbi:SCO family protein [Parendozoicomonas haliclonae]|uniref:Thioredoxin domain-containing protein n=1 Tax=Parendozoicomonas haliclonae TaxID=1960125 RepID=A0A1X7AJR6_9GAMM|nr:SCO family protein [Parendozoicomonas haliclonae]SMA46267.1 hypothetical protein EHSB41UT_02116 [Parendozoicomonas haliclonae]